MMHRKKRLPVITALIFSLGILQACSGSSADNGESFQPSSLTVNPMARPEGGPDEASILRFRVTLTEPQPRAVTVRYATSAITAIPGEDYLDTSGELIIPPGALDGSIEVELIGDTEEEPNESFLLSFETSKNATPTAESARATIGNDDSRCDAAFDKLPNPWLVNGGDPLNFAHRGGVTDFPENTLYAYTEAALAGADVLEMDVFQTSDNHLVVLHDAAGVGRTTNGDGAIVDMTLAEVQALDAAYWFIPGEGTRRDRDPDDYIFRGIATGEKAPPPGYSATDFRIPTLPEALSRFADHRINVELKQDDGEGAYEQQMADLLLSFGRRTDLIVATFDDEVSAKFKAVAPCIYTSLPLGVGLDIFAVFLGTGVLPEVPQHIAAQIPPDANQIGDEIPGDDSLPIVTPELVAAAHAVNMPVQVWTINACEDMLWLIELGVDGIMTDRPLLLESLLQQPPGERRCEQAAT